MEPSVEHLQIYDNYFRGCMKDRIKNQKKIDKPCRQLHKLRYYKIIQDLVREHHEPGETILIRVFYNHIYPIYPMSYSQFRRIMEEPRLNARIKELEEIEREN